MRFIILVTIFLYSVSAFAQRELKVGDKAPAILFQQSYPPAYKIPKHKAIFLEFWATWCGPCVAGLIESKGMAGKYAKQIEFIAITDTTSRKLKEFIASRKFNYQFLVDRDTLTFGNYGVNGIPHAFLIDSNQVIQWSGRSREFTEDMVKEFLATNRVIAVESKSAFDKKRFDSSNVSPIQYSLLVTDKELLKTHATLLKGKETDEKGSYSNAPEWDHGKLTVINYSLPMLQERVQTYFNMQFRTTISILLLLMGLHSIAQKKAALMQFHKNSSWCNGGVYTTKIDFTAELFNDSSIHINLYESGFPDIYYSLSRVTYTGSFTMRNDTIMVTYTNANAAIAWKRDWVPNSKCMDQQSLQQQLLSQFNPPSIFVIRGNKLAALNSNFLLEACTLDKENGLNAKFETWSYFPLPKQIAKKPLLSITGLYPWRNSQTQVQ